MMLTKKNVDDMPTPRVFTSSNFCQNKLYLIAGCDRMGVALDSAECWNPEGKEGEQWTILPAVPTKKAATCAITIDNQIFTFGGICGNKKQVSAVEMFDINSLSWTTLPSLPEPTQGIGLVSRKDKILGVGGVAEGLQPLSRFFCFDISRHKFANFPDLPTPRFQPAVAYVPQRDCLYVLGGRIGKESTNVCEVFEFRTLRWRSLPDKPSEKRVFPNWLRIDEKIYIIGGLRDKVTDGFSTCVDVFDLDTETWSSGPPLSLPRADACIGQIENHLVLAGGIGGAGVETSLHSLQLNDNKSKWVTHSTTNFAHASAGFCSFNDSLLLLGGMDPSGLLQKAELITME